MWRARCSNIVIRLLHVVSHIWAATARMVSFFFSNPFVCVKEAGFNQYTEIQVQIRKPQRLTFSHRNQVRLTIYYLSNISAAFADMVTALKRAQFIFQIFLFME